VTVAIDGPAGAGKSTLAKFISKEFGFFNLNSGNFYRAVTRKMQMEGIPLENADEIVSLARNLHLELVKGRLHSDGTDVDDHLHTDAIDSLVAQVSALVPVRHAVNEKIRKVTLSMDIVAEGRDMTTVVFPDADLKIYLDASINSRTSRRFDQKISNLTRDEIAETLIKRDEIDKNKKEGSLTIAEDALYLDTSDLTLEQVYERVIHEIRMLKGTQETGSKMADMVNQSVKQNVQNEMQEQYLKAMEHVEEGQLVEGIVVQLDNESVFIDIGQKAEGKIPFEDFDVIPKLGDKVEVVLVSREGRNGQPVVSKKKADAKKYWKNLKDAFDNNTTVKGKVEAVIKGGFDVDLGGGMKGFVPMSKMDVVRIETPEQYIGITSEFAIERLYQDKKINIVLSRRKWLEESSEKSRTHFFETVKVGDIVEGTVKSFTSFGSFIDLGGFDGLLHINDMGWGHVSKPKDFVKKGQVIKLRVIHIDVETKKVNLSLKDLSENPWDGFGDRYHPDQIVKGKVTKLTDFGAFIEIERGVEGLAHISELSWVKRIKHPREVLNVGDDVDVMILDYNPDEQRISLGVKQVQANPWDGIDQKFPEGAKVTGTIVKVINSGAFIELEDGIEGFIHIDDYSWTQKIKNPASVFKTGETVEAVVLGSRGDTHKIKLGVRQLSDDPWVRLQKSCSRGTVIDGIITGKTDFGIFVKVQGDIEALIHKNNLEFGEDESADDALAKMNIGDSVKAAVIEIIPAKKKMALSMREIKKMEERQELSRYLHEDETVDTDRITIGDFMKK
jgi:small subunit ribosomal protein S1